MSYKVPIAAPADPFTWEDFVDQAIGHGGGVAERQVYLAHRHAKKSDAELEQIFAGKGFITVAAAPARRVARQCDEAADYAATLIETKAAIPNPLTTEG